MKKLAIVASMLFAASVSAAELSASYFHDSKVEKDGVRVELSAGSLMGLKPVLGVTHINNTYTRYSVGSDFQLSKVGNVSLALSGSGVFQDTSVGQDGFGLTVGAKASVPLSKSVDLVGRVDRFVGQSRVNAFNGTVGSVGVAVRF